MRVTPFYFRFYICVQIFITIERIIKFFFLGVYGPLIKRISQCSIQLKFKVLASCEQTYKIPRNTLKLINCSIQKRTIKVIIVEIDPTMYYDKIKRQRFEKKGVEPLNSNVRYFTDRDHRVYQGRDGEKQYREIVYSSNESSCRTD